MLVRVRVPASSANLGPGFDALGLALALYNEVTIEELDRVAVSIEGEHLLSLAARAEGHPDNVAAAMLGGLTVSCADGGRVRAIRLAVPADLRFVVLVPDAESATREARAVLPAEVPRADAVFNI